MSQARAAEPVPMNVQADSVNLDLERDTTEATGHAQLTHGDIVLKADRITADRKSGDVLASGHLSLEQKGRRIEGDTLTYNFLSQRGALQSAWIREQGVIIRGERIDFSPLEVAAHHAYFTTCDKPKPDYSLSADEITLTAAQAAPGKQPQSGRLTLSRARVTYHGRRLFALPHYSTTVGQIGQQSTSPFPSTGFDRDDGPYAALSYNLSRPGSPNIIAFSYRLTTSRGVRGHLRFERDSGPLQLSAAYVRREAVTDRELRPDDFSTGLANVMVNREPEVRALIPSLPAGRSLSLRTELTAGSYSETQISSVIPRARADRISGSALLTYAPYRISHSLSLSHAIGWRESAYSTGQDFSIRFLRHSIAYSPSGPAQVAFSYITRRGSGTTPFFFDRIEVGRELLSDMRYRVSPIWRVRVVSLYDLGRHDVRDMILSVTRTVHCLDYTVGWRKTRGAFFFGINIAPPSTGGREHERAGTPTLGEGIPPLAEY
jgi:LPS-assembly protein